MTVEAPPERAAPPSPTIRRGTALGVGLALASTMAVFVLGDLGAPIRVETGWNPEGADLLISEVVGTASVSVVLGGLMLWLLERSRPAGSAPGRSSPSRLRSCPRFHSCDLRSMRAQRSA